MTSEPYNLAADIRERIGKADYTPAILQQLLKSAQAIEEERDALREEVAKMRAIFHAIATRNSKGEDITLAHDWGFGSGTLVFGDGGHTHFGMDTEEDEGKALNDYIQGLHGLLVEGRGLSVMPAEDGQDLLPGPAVHREDDQVENISATKG